MEGIFASSIGDFVRPAVESMSILGSLVCSFLLVWSGIKYITSSGDVSKMMAAKRSIVRSLIGLVIIIASFSLSGILLHAYGPASAPATNQLPSLSNIQTPASSNGLVDILIKAISGLMDAIIKSASKPFIQGLIYFTKSTPLLVHNSSVLHLWLVSVGIADGLLALAVALIGFHVMSAEHFGLHAVELRSLLPQLLFTVVIINSSIYLLDGIIELSNAMIGAINTGSGGLTPWNSLLAIVNQLNGYSIAALFIYVIFLVFTVILLIYYIGRIVALYVGAVLAPIIILISLIPGFRDFAENALKTYISTVFVLFVHVVILALAGSLFSEFKQTDSIMILLLGLATLVALIKTQGVMMQLNYASIGPRMARKLSGSFVNGVAFVATSSRYAFAGSLPIAAAVSNFKNYFPEPGPKRVKVKSAKGPRQ